MNQRGSCSSFIVHRSSFSSAVAAILARHRSLFNTPRAAVRERRQGLGPSTRTGRRRCFVRGTRLCWTGAGGGRKLLVGNPRSAQAPAFGPGRGRTVVL